MGTCAVFRTWTSVSTTTAAATGLAREFSRSPSPESPGWRRCDHGRLCSAELAVALVSVRSISAAAAAAIRECRLSSLLRGPHFFFLGCRGFRRRDPACMCACLGHARLQADARVSKLQTKNFSDDQRDTFILGVGVNRAEAMGRVAFHWQTVKKKKSSRSPPPPPPPPPQLVPARPHTNASSWFFLPEQVARISKCSGRRLNEARRVPVDRRVACRPRRRRRQTWQTRAAAKATATTMRNLARHSTTEM